MKSKKSKKKFNPSNLIIVLATLFLAFSGYIFLDSRQDAKYDEFKTVTTTDQKISINVPEKMNETQAGITAIDYEDRLDDQSLVSHIRVESQFLGSDFLGSTKDEIIGQLKSKNGEYYEMFKTKTNTNPAAKNLNFEGFSDYAVADKKGVISNFTYQFDEVSIYGRILVILENDKIYFVIAEADQDIWTKNLNVWDKVFESLRIS